MAEIIFLMMPRRWLKVTSVLFGVAGLIAHTIYLIVYHPTAANAHGSLLLLGWVFGVFYLSAMVHSRTRVWAVFVLPLVIILVGLSYGFRADQSTTWFSGNHFWGTVHGLLLLLGYVGITMGFLASIMYLIQSRRLRQKKALLGGFKLLNLERLEDMNRRGIYLAMPFLTVGLLLGILRLPWTEFANQQWTTPKIVATAGLWLTMVLLIYLRYSTSVASRRLAWFTIACFVLMLCSLLASHPFAPGVKP
ncbi:MAG: cytochrome c biogenesis protein CcsA [Zavarzinella sp.]